MQVSFTHVKIRSHVSPNLSGGTSDVWKLAWKTGMDWMNVACVMQSLSVVWISLAVKNKNKYQNRQCFAEMFALWLYPRTQRFAGQNKYFFSKLKILLDINTV